MKTRPALIALIILLLCAAATQAQLGRSKKFKWSTDTMLIDSVSVRALNVTTNLTADTFGVEGTFACSLFDNATFRQTVTARYQNIGNITTVHLPALQGIVSGGAVYINGFPAAIFPPGEVGTVHNIPLLVLEDAGAVHGGRIVSNGSTLRVYTLAGANPAAGTFLIHNQPITYLIND